MRPTRVEADRLATFWTRFYARQAATRGIGPERLRGAVRAGVGEAAERFDPSSGRSFQSCAASPIRRAIAALLAPCPEPRRGCVRI